VLDLKVDKQTIDNQTENKQAVVPAFFKPTLLWSKPMINNTSSHHAAEKKSLYDAIGGEHGVQNLVKVFYDLVEQHPEGHKLHLLHLRGNGIAHSRVEQFNFLSGFLGGPKLYVEKHGHSNVRVMHEHVEIDSEAKDIWLKCMDMAIDEIGVGAEVKVKLMNNFTTIANLLVNRTD
jgi:hemoglobin